MAKCTAMSRRISRRSNSGEAVLDRRCKLMAALSVYPAGVRMAMEILSSPGRLIDYLPDQRPPRRGIFWQRRGLCGLQRPVKAALRNQRRQFRNGFLPVGRENSKIAHVNHAVVV